MFVLSFGNGFSNLIKQLCVKKFDDKNIKICESFPNPVYVTGLDIVRIKKFFFLFSCCILIYKKVKDMKYFYFSFFNNLTKLFHSFKNQSLPLNIQQQLLIKLSTINSSNLRSWSFFISNKRINKKKNFSHQIDNFMFYVIGDCKDFYTFHFSHTIKMSLYTKIYIIKIK